MTSQVQPWKTIYSQQYGKPCVIASPTDAANDVIAACRASGAINKGLVCDICDGSHRLTYAADFVEVNGYRYHARLDGTSDHEAPCYNGDDKFVVQLCDDVGPELWTEAALRRSLGKEI